jgi:hypothetical protein
MLAFVLVEFAFLACAGGSVYAAVRCCKYTRAKRKLVDSVMTTRKLKTKIAVVFGVDLLLCFALTQVTLSLVIPNTYIFATRLGESVNSVSIFADEASVASFARCNYTGALAEAKSFYRCANVDFADVDVLVGGAPDYLPDVPAMCVGNLIMIRRSQTFATGRKASCISTATFVHECFHLWQVQNHPLTVGGTIELLHQQATNRSEMYNYG